jgi:predicted DNA binding CopG/RHH family protein
MKNYKKIPKFKSEAAENKFWQQQDASEYFDLSKPVQLDLSNLKPSTKTITLRIPESMYLDLKSLANQRDVPYQSMMKIFLADKIREQFGSSSC